MKRFAAFAPVVAFLTLSTFACADSISWDYTSSYLTKSPDGYYSQADWAPWSTGYMSGDTFTAFNHFGYPVTNLAVWSQATSYDDYGHAWKNTGSSPITLDLGYLSEIDLHVKAQLEAGQTGIMLGGTTRNTVIRWTAPTAGLYAVSAAFSKQDMWPLAPIDVSVSNGGTGLFASILDGYSGSAASNYTDGYDGPAGTRNATYAGTVQLAQNDVLMFRCAAHPGDTALNWVGTSFSIIAIPEPTSIVLLAAGMLGLLAYAWRKRR